MVTKEKLLEQLEEWMDWLETPNDDFGGYPVCPFLAPERKTNQLLIEFYDHSTEHGVPSRMKTSIENSTKNTS